MDVYPEKEVLQVDEFKMEDTLDHNGMSVYVHRNAYEYLPENVNIDYSGYWYKELHITSYTPARLRGSC